jgi:hypothetical protein
MTLSINFSPREIIHDPELFDHIAALCDEGQTEIITDCNKKVASNNFKNTAGKKVEGIRVL